VGRFLSDHYGESITAEVAGTGMWSTCYGFVLAGERLVARFGRHAGDFECDRIAADFAAPMLPIPRVYEIGEVLDGYYAISDRAEGTPLEDSTPEQWRTLVAPVAAALAAMCAVEPPPGWGG